MLGTWLSFTVTVKEQLALRPEASVTRQRTWVGPLGKIPPEAMPLIRERVVPAQLSDDVGLA